METIIAAVVAAVPATIVAVATWRRVGKTNGAGSIAAMVEHTVEMLEAMNSRLDNLDNSFIQHLLQGGTHHAPPRRRA